MHVVAFFLLICLSNLSFTAFSQKADMAAMRLAVQKAEFFLNMEQSGVRCNDFLDSMPYSPHQNTYVTYYEDNRFTNVFWEERENSDGKKEIWVNFIVYCNPPFEFRNADILEMDFLPNEKDQRFIRAYQTFYKAKLMIDPFEGFYAYGDKLFPVFIEENGQVVAYVRRIRRNGIPRFGDGFKVEFNGRQIGRILPLVEKPYNIYPANKNGDFVFHLHASDCVDGSLPVFLIRDILLYQELYDWDRIIMLCDKHLILYDKRINSWLIEPPQKYGEYLKVK